MEVPNDPRRDTASRQRDGDEYGKQQKRVTHHDFVYSRELLPAV
jgi:hypothetical protein